jgi:hypothetical protein
MYQRNSPQYGDALALLQSLSDCCTPLVFFDPQNRGGHASAATFNRISWEAPNQGEFSWDP